jgi:hypothetical protein
VAVEGRSGQCVAHQAVYFRATGHRSLDIADNAIAY